jgi:hypothetical protein
MNRDRRNSCRRRGRSQECVKESIEESAKKSGDYSDLVRKSHNKPDCDSAKPGSSPLGKAYARSL